jgi:hypothetical protein
LADATVAQVAIVIAPMAIAMVVPNFLSFIPIPFNVDSN